MSSSEQQVNFINSSSSADIIEEEDLLQIYISSNEENNIQPLDVSLFLKNFKILYDLEHEEK